MKPTILVVDDQPSVRESLKVILEPIYQVRLAESGKKALEEIKTRDVSVVLLDILMPEMDGLAVLKEIKRLDLPIETIIITASQAIDHAVEAMKKGAYDYITKPWNVDNLLSVVERAVEKVNLTRENVYLKTEKAEKLRGREIIGESRAIKELLATIEKVSQTDVTVLITGESGTGKELVAQAIHQRSARREKPFVVVNCAAIPSELVESELWGHEKGAFTSAINRRIGKFEFANGGTIFLDEIGALSLNVQAKLLRCLEEKEIVRVGSNKIIPVDIRIISATNIDLKEAIKRETFREDLYYRLKVVPINIPPLRERKEDIPLLVDYFLKKSARRFKKNIKDVTQGLLEIFKEYHWPGNVRELEHIIDMLIVLSEGEYLTPENLPLNILTSKSSLEETASGEVLSLKKAIHQFERQYIKKVLEKAHWNRSKAAYLLGVHRNTLLGKIQELSLQEEIRRHKRKNK
jgi:two-component system response regulator AtoC